MEAEFTTNRNWDVKFRASRVYPSFHRYMDSYIRGCLTVWINTTGVVKQDTILARSRDVGAVLYTKTQLLKSLLLTNLSGFLFDLRIVDKEEIEEAILAANIDPTVHGIIVYYPIFPAPSRQDQYIQQLVSLQKDVEGLSHTYVFNMYQNIRFLDPPTNTQKSILPCTPLAVVKVLENLQIYNSILPYGNRLFGKTITVINRSEVVGRPLAALLANDGAKVYSVDLDGVQLFTRGQGIKKQRHEVHIQKGWTSKDCLPLSDVVISGVPGEKFKVETDLIRDGAACINFSSEKNFDGPAVKEKASIYVPAIGKVTIAVLLRNLLVSSLLSYYLV
jgi:methylenetetrahydrofolate dehydrogenase (NAD+)